MPKFTITWRSQNIYEAIVEGEDYTVAQNNLFASLEPDPIELSNLIEGTDDTLLIRDEAGEVVYRRKREAGE